MQRVLGVSSGPVLDEPQEEVVAEAESQEETQSPTKKLRKSPTKMNDKENVHRSTHAKAKVSYIKTEGGNSQSADDATPCKRNRRQTDQVESGAKHTPKKKQK